MGSSDRAFAVRLQFHEVNHLFDIAAVFSFFPGGLAPEEHRLQEVVAQLLVAGQHQIVEHGHAPEQLEVLKGPGNAQHRYLMR